MISSCPCVRVPVLSNTTIVIDYIFWRTVPPSLSKTPKLAATPAPTITAVGVANPRAHGHAITRVEMPKSKANSNLLLYWASRLP